jgi:hypothetical protein
MKSGTRFLAIGLNKKSRTLIYYIQTINILFLKEGKMNYLIIGNIASGKTSLAEAIAAKKHAEFFSIDDMRSEYSDGTFAGEFKAWHKMLEAIQHPSPNGDGIYEFSGTGKNAWFVREAIKHSQIHHEAKWLAIYCLCDKEELKNRCKNKKYSAPIPYKFDNPAASISYMSEELQKKYGSNYWNCPETTVRTDQLTPEAAADAVLAFIEG